ncbi:MAG: hypothetical protein ACOYLC_03910 [Armatimonadaceae bacterium]
MRFRFSTMTTVFGLLTIGCGFNVYSIITTGEMSIGRSSRPMYERLNPSQMFAPRSGEFVLRQSELPGLLPIMIVLVLAFAYATYWSSQTDA